MKATVRGVSIGTSSPTSGVDPLAISVTALVGVIVLALVKVLSGRDQVRRRVEQNNSAVAPSNVFRELQQSKATAGVSNATDSFTRAVRVTLLNLPEELTMDEFNGEDGKVDGAKVEEYIWAFATSCANSLIPFNHTRDLQPRNPENLRVLKPITMASYIGSHIKLLRQLFPDCSLWNDLVARERPAFWTEIRANFLIRSEKYQNQNAPEGVYEQPIVPMYASLRADENDPTSRMSLENIQIYNYRNACKQQINPTRRQYW